MTKETETNRKPPRYRANKNQYFKTRNLKGKSLWTCTRPPRDLSGMTITSSQDRNEYQRQRNATPEILYRFFLYQSLNKYAMDCRLPYHEWCKIKGIHEGNHFRLRRWNGERGHSIENSYCLETFHSMPDRPSVVVNRYGIKRLTMPYQTVDYSVITVRKKDNGIEYLRQRSDIPEMKYNQFIYYCLNHQERDCTLTFKQWMALTENGDGKRFRLMRRDMRKGFLADNTYSRGLDSKETEIPFVTSSMADFIKTRTNNRAGFQRTRPTEVKSQKSDEG